MHFPHHNPFIRLRLLQGLLGVLLLPLIAGVAWSHSYGPADGVCGDPPAYANCTQCHNSFSVNSGDGQLQLLGLPLAYVPDSTYTLAIVLVDTGQIRWGFEMTAILNSGDQAGVLTPDVPLLVQISEGPGAQRDYIKQTTLGTLEGSPAGAWSVAWTAPAAASDSVHFYLAGNAANGNGTNQGDYIYTISVHVPEFALGVKDAPAALPGTTFLSPAYPNPFNPATAIGYQLSLPNFVELKMFDTAGGLITTLQKGWQNAGTYQATFDGSGLPSGIYIYRLTAGDFAATGKVVLMK